MKTSSFCGNTAAFDCSNPLPAIDWPRSGAAPSGDDDDAYASESSCLILSVIAEVTAALRLASETPLFDVS